jgi:hypothetical protein
LPIAQTSSGWVTIEDVEAYAKGTDEILVVSEALIRMAEGKTAKAQINPEVLSVLSGFRPIFQDDDPSIMNWPRTASEEPTHSVFWSRTCEAAIARAVSRAWGCSYEEFIAQNSLDRNKLYPKRQIGILAGEPLFARVLVFRRHLTNSDRSTDEVFTPSHV